MRLGVVIDGTEPLSVPAQASMAALLEAFAAAQEPGDALGVYVAGARGGPDIALGDVRYGTVRALLDGWGSSVGTDGLAAALERAESAVGAADEGFPGSRAIVLITARPEGLAELDAEAHRRAVDGITTSVIALRGNPVVVPAFVALAQAGQGSLHAAEDPERARAIVEREFEAASRIVARSIRLKVRLAPGVALIDVLGSEPLGAVATERVREAEQADDRRLARSLGIEADRGEDTEGIQIVIPWMLADDEHAVVLDLLVPGPGPVLDASVRFKDLVALRNAEGRSSLALRRGGRAAGPLQEHVHAHLVAHDLAWSLRTASHALLRERPDEALALLSEAAAWLDGLRALRPTLDAVASLREDAQAVRTLRDALRDRQAEDPRAWSDALAWAAHRKIGPMPLEVR